MHPFVRCNFRELLHDVGRNDVPHVTLRARSSWYGEDRGANGNRQHKVKRKGDLLYLPDACSDSRVETRQLSDLRDEFSAGKKLIEPSY